MNIQMPGVIRYSNPNFNEAAMVRKIRKNQAAGWSVQRLYQALREEKEMCEHEARLCPDTAIYSRRALELNDQMLFMQDHVFELGLTDVRQLTEQKHL